MPIPNTVNYPTSLDTTSTLFGYQTNQTEFDLDLNVGSLDTEINTLQSVESLSYPQLFVFTDDGEIIYATGVTASGSLVVERGGSGTHTAGDARLRMVMFADYLNQLRRATLAIEGELGADPSSTYSTVAARFTAIQSSLTETSASVTSVKNRDFSINVILGSGDNAITADKSYAWLRMPYSGSLTSYEIYAETSGSVSVDIWKSTYDNLPSAVGDSICGSNYVYLSGSATTGNNKDTSLSGWTKTFDAGDWFVFHTNALPDPTASQVTIALIGKVID